MGKNPSSPTFPPPGQKKPPLGITVAFIPVMKTGSNLLEPEPRGKRRGEETTRQFWKPPLPDAAEPREAPVPKARGAVPYLLAPAPWPQGQFRIDPES